MRRILLVTVLFLAACASSPAHEQPLFEFHDNFWLNLHLFLRAAARGMPAEGSLSPGERAEWDAATAFYRPYTKRELLFDQGMVDIENELLRFEGKESLDASSLDPALVETLTRAAPIYRKYWWPAQNERNEKWIAEVRPLIRKYGGSISTGIASAYGVVWPREPVPVDVTVTAGPNNAFTTTRPTHTTIASTEPSVSGPAALEILFHEASHEWGQPLQGGIARAETAHHKTMPEQLWHAVLFYNAGELTRRALAADGRDYQEYAARYEVYRQLCGEGCRERVAAAWNRHLDGSLTVDEALDALVSSWPQ